MWFKLKFIKFNTIINKTDAEDYVLHENHIYVLPLAPSTLLIIILKPHIQYDHWGDAAIIKLICILMILMLR